MKGAVKMTEIFGEPLPCTPIRNFDNITLYPLRGIFLNIGMELQYLVYNSKVENEQNTLRYINKDGIQYDITYGLELRTEINQSDLISVIPEHITKINKKITQLMIFKRMLLSRISDVSCKDKHINIPNNNSGPNGVILYPDVIKILTGKGYLNAKQIIIDYILGIIDNYKIDSELNDNELYAKFLLVVMAKTIDGYISSYKLLCSAIKNDNKISMRDIKSFDIEQEELPSIYVQINPNKNRPYTTDFKIKLRNKDAFLIFYRDTKEFFADACTLRFDNQFDNWHIYLGDFKLKQALQQTNITDTFNILDAKLNAKEAFYKNIRI